MPPSLCHLPVSRPRQPLSAPTPSTVHPQATPSPSPPSHTKNGTSPTTGRTVPSRHGHLSPWWPFRPQKPWCWWWSSGGPPADQLTWFLEPSNTPTYCAGHPVSPETTISQLKARRRGPQSSARPPGCPTSPTHPRLHVHDLRSQAADPQPLWHWGCRAVGEG